MKAFIVESYGKDGLRAADVPKPGVGRRDVLVQVRAASINPLDKMVRNGEFKQLLKYKRPPSRTGARRLWPRDGGRRGRACLYGRR